MFQLGLLGGVQIVGPAGPIGGRVAQRRQLALLSFLALQNRPTSRDRLLAVFWPENDTERLIGGWLRDSVERHGPVPRQPTAAAGTER
jgi:hypothetical protein